MHEPLSPLSGLCFCLALQRTADNAEFVTADPEATHPAHGEGSVAIGQWKQRMSFQCVELHKSCGKFQVPCQTASIPMPAACLVWVTESYGQGTPKLQG